MQESDMYRRMNRDGFSRVLFWKFNNLCMFLGSYLLIFSNEKYVSVSVHLWDVSGQVTPLTWLDNVMAGVPELAICYHQNGVVQGYELLKTDDILLSKGVSEDGIPAFHPHIVRQNGHSVLRFLQENCKQDPGAYWLYKNAGEGILLYRVAYRLSLFVYPHNRGRCARFLKKCLDFLDQPDHMMDDFGGGILTKEGVWRCRWFNNVSYDDGKVCIYLKQRFWEKHWFFAPTLKSVANGPRKASTSLEYGM